MTPTPETKAHHLTAFTISTHHISEKRADTIAADVLANLEHIGWGGRPDVIKVLTEYEQDMAAGIRLLPIADVIDRLRVVLGEIEEDS